MALECGWVNAPQTVVTDSDGDSRRASRTRHTARSRMDNNATAMARAATAHACLRVSGSTCHGHPLRATGVWPSCSSLSDSEHTRPEPEQTHTHRRAGEKKRQMSDPSRKTIAGPISSVDGVYGHFCREAQQAESDDPYDASRERGSTQEREARLQIDPEPDAHGDDDKSHRAHPGALSRQVPSSAASCCSPARSGTRSRPMPQWTVSGSNSISR